MITDQSATSDFMLLLHTLDELGEVNRDQLLAHLDGWSPARLAATLGNASMAGDVRNGYSTALFQLTPSARQRLATQAQRDTQPQAAVGFSELRAAYERSLPAHRRTLEEQAAQARLARFQALGAEERAVRAFISPLLLGEGWAFGPEPDERADNVLALFPPPFPDRTDLASVHVRVKFDAANNVVWLRASSDGPILWVGERWDRGQVRDQVLRVLVPALDPTVTPLPTLADALPVNETPNGLTATEGSDPS